MSEFLLVLVLLLEASLGSADVRLELRSDGPAVLDAPINFHADLIFDDGEDDDDDLSLNWKWTDNVFPPHLLEVETKNRSMDFLLTYPAAEYEPQEYEMTVSVYKRALIFYWELLAESTVKFRITLDLNGNLEVVTKKPQSKKNTVSNEDLTEIRINLYDPHDYLKEAQLRYFWFVNDTNFGQTDNSSFFNTFATPGVCFVEVTVMAYMNTPQNIPDHKRFRSADELLRNVTEPSSSPSKKKKITNKFGVFKVKLNSQAPIKVMNVSGDLWLKHGNLLDLAVNCDGSGPWNFCWSIKKPGYNVTGNETCSGSSTASTGSDSPSCDFRVVWYFRESGLKNVLLVAENDISKQIKLMGINVYDVVPQTPLSFVVVPIVSALAAVVAVMIAIVIMITFRRNLAVETADFDFSIQDEQLEYKTFWERLRDSMMNAFGNSSDDVSSNHSSNSSNGTGNSVRPPIGIHYGSIT